MKKNDDDSVSANCQKCGHIHDYESLEIMESMPASTPCTKCGYLFLNHMRNKIEAVMTLLQTDPHFVTLMNSGDMDKTNAYIREKTGLE